MSPILRNKLFRLAAWLVRQCFGWLIDNHFNDDLTLPVITTGNTSNKLEFKNLWLSVHWDCNNFIIWTPIRKPRYENDLQNVSKIKCCSGKHFVLKIIFLASRIKGMKEIIINYINIFTMKTKKGKMRMISRKTVIIMVETTEEEEITQK